MANRAGHRLLRAGLIGIALALAAGFACAQSYPDKPVRMIFGLTVGSSSDITMRIIAQKLTEKWGQPVLVDNRPGAGGNIAAEMVVKAPPDGYTLLLSNVSIAIAPAYYRKLSYNPLTELVPVSHVTSLPHIACVNPSLPVNSVQDLIALAKSKPDELMFSSAGLGQTDHMATELFAQMAGIKMRHIPYKGGPQALTAVATGEVALDFPGLPAALPFLKSGKVRCLALTTAKRSAAVPDIPTLAESGLTGYEHSLWNGVFAPVGTPPAILAKVSEDIAAVLKLPDVQERFAQLSIESVGSTPAHFDAFFKAEVAKWVDVIKTTGIRGD